MKVHPDHLKENLIDISFKNITYKVTIKQGKEIQEKIILDNVSGVCKNGEVTAILGSSGAGKTTLLNILCKRIYSIKGKAHLEGKIMANNTEYNHQMFPNFAAYVMQDDRLIDALTVKETLEFAANLRIKGNAKLKDEKVSEVIKFLRLDKCQDVMVGGVFIKGISGGERKRTSIAFELITDPQVIFLDEPTSGLDSFTAFLLIILLKRYATDYKKTVVFTIHQPSSDIWNLFDRIFLLVEGKFIYQGPGCKNIINYFTNMGFKCPRYSNPADYYLSIMHKESDLNKQNYSLYFQTFEQKIKNQVDQEIEERNQGIVKKFLSINSFFFEFFIIQTRTLKQLRRNPIIMKARLINTVVMALLTGAIWWQLGNGETLDINKYPTQEQQKKFNLDQQRIMWDKNGFLFTFAVSNFMASLNPTILTFPSERAVFLKEENAKLYRVSSYFLGKTALEFPIQIIFPSIMSAIVYWMSDLNDDTVGIVITFFFITILEGLNGNSLGLLGGAIFKSPQTAMGMLPILMLPFMLFGGFFANSQSYGQWIGWLKYLSPFKYGMESYAQNEYKNTKFVPNPLIQLGFEQGLWDAIGILIALFLGFRLLAYIVLVTQKDRLQ